MNKNSWYEPKIQEKSGVYPFMNQAKQAKKTIAGLYLGFLTKKFEFSNSLFD